jgi:3-oxoacyl-[acyl-carrier-protein] synthase-3
VTPDYPLPSLHRLQGKLGNKRPAFDLAAACASIYARRLVLPRVRLREERPRAGRGRLTRVTDWTDRNTAILFGDGAGAMVQSPLTIRGVASSPPVSRRRCTSDSSSSPAAGQAPDLGRSSAADALLKMNGREVFKFSVRALGRAVARCWRRRSSRPAT